MAGEEQTQGVRESTLRSGQIVGGKYCVDKLIGKGGMAEVWAGTNERTGKRIALKVILRSFASSSDAVELFRREALAASRVNHPNVVNVFDVIDHDGMTCIVMELLEGESLGAYLRRKGILGVNEAVTLLLPAMRGVAAANAEGVVHRDLKPQNIFICIGTDGRLITTKVLDFGISIMQEKSVDSAQVTQLLATHGTPAYMSPEHISGAPDIDSRADVYGFGVLFFETLTGQLPFLGDPGPALLVRILNDPPPKVTLFRPDLSPLIVEIIERAMAKAPEDRFPTLNDFIRAVEEQVLPPSPLPRALTPMAGVPLFTYTEQPSGVADSVVQVRRGEPSGMHEVNETRAMFTLPRELESAGGDSSPQSGVQAHASESPALTTTQVNLRSLRQGVGWLLAGRARMAAMFVAVVAIVAWLAFPSPSQYRGGDESPSNSRAARSAPVAPAAVATPVRAAAAPTPVPAVSSQDADSTHIVEVAQRPQPTLPEPTVQREIPRQNPVHQSVSVRGSARRALAAQPLERRATKAGASVTPTATQTETQAAIKTEPPTATRPQSSPTPRAGTLSPEDF
jgi:serine/threonine protein kinase